jgi:hypothetical protein
MMKSSISVSKSLFAGVFMLVGMASAISVKAQTPSFSCYITNEVLVSPTVYQFDIYLLKTGGPDFQYAAGQWGITVNPDVANGGNLTASIVQGSTLLEKPAQANVTAILPAVTSVFNIAAKAPPGTGNGSKITDVNGGCASPGTKVATFKITNSVPFAPNSKMNHTFNFTSGAGKTATKIHAYVNGLNTDITGGGTFYGYNTTGTCMQNIGLNSTLTTVTEHTATDMIVSVYPNPANTLTTVGFVSKNASHYHLSLVDALGQELAVKEGMTTAGENFIPLNLEGVAKGVYEVKLMAGDKTSVVRTIVD